MPIQDEQPGLKQLVKTRLLNDVFQAALDKAPGWKILVVDDEATRVISSAVGMYDIMERRITIVESLERKRAPFTGQGVIYLMKPTKASIDLLLADYADKSKILYGPDVFLFFLSRVPEELLSLIKGCRPLLKRLKTLSEINIDFLVKEERAFTLNMKDSFVSLYSRSRSSEEIMAEKLVTVCATMNEYPHIRYNQSSDICKSAASIFHHKMNQFVESNPSWWYYGAGKDARSMKRDRSVLLLLDRAEDALTPLMHDFTYESLVRDFLQMDGYTLTLQSENPDDSTEKEKQIFLKEKDALWVELRNEHIGKIGQILKARIKAMNDSDAAKLNNKGEGGEGAPSFKELKAAMDALPEYREALGKLSTHMDISAQCLKKASKPEFMDLFEIEQTLATGTDDEGRTPKMTEIIDRVELALRKTDDIKARLRMLLIATISQQGLDSVHRRRMIDAADFSPDHIQTIDSLRKLGLETVSPENGRSSLRVSSSASAFDDDEDEELVSSRYPPVLKSILNSLVGDGEPLSFSKYPSVVPMPEASASSGTAASARKRGTVGTARKAAATTSKWVSSGGKAGKKSKHAQFTGGRTLLFMVGGMSYSEISIARDFMQKENCEIVCGSTEFRTASEFIDDLSALGSS